VSLLSDAEGVQQNSSISSIKNNTSFATQFEGGGEGASEASSRQIDYEQSNLVLTYNEAIGRTVGPKDSSFRYTF
jgi:hypothetical protein